MRLKKRKDEGSAWSADKLYPNSGIIGFEKVLAHSFPSHNKEFYREMPIPKKSVRKF